MFWFCIVEHHLYPNLHLIQDSFYGQREEPELQELPMFQPRLPSMPIFRLRKRRDGIADITNTPLLSIVLVSFLLLWSSSSRGVSRLFLETSAESAFSPSAAWAPTSLRRCSDSAVVEERMSGATLGDAGLAAHPTVQGGCLCQGWQPRVNKGYMKEIEPSRGPIAVNASKKWIHCVKRFVFPGFWLNNWIDWE